MNLSLNLPEPIVRRLEQAAKQTNKSLVDFLSDRVSEIALDESRARYPAADYNPPTAAIWAKSFTVANEIPGLPIRSTQLAQRFVDAMLDHNGMNAQRTSSGGVLFSDNFAHIERIYSRDSGFIVSFYGAPENFRKLNSFIGRGRGDSYSRMTVRTDEELEAAIRSIPVARRLKHG